MPRKKREGNLKEIRTFSPDLAAMVEKQGFKFPDDGILELNGVRTIVSFAAVEKLSEIFGYMGKTAAKKICDERLAQIKRSRGPQSKPPPKLGEVRAYKATAIGGSPNRRNALISVGVLFPANAGKDGEVMASYEKDKIIITAAKKG